MDNLPANSGGAASVPIIAPPPPPPAAEAAAIIVNVTPSPKILPTAAAAPPAPGMSPVVQTDAMLRSPTAAMWAALSDADGGPGRLASAGTPRAFDVLPGQTVMN